MTHGIDELLAQPAINGKRPHYLVFDATNIIHRTFFAQEGSAKRQAQKHTAGGLANDENGMTDDQALAGLAHYIALATLNKYYTRFNPDKVILTFDRSNWRKVYTKSDKCLSGAVYKGTRRQNMSDSQQDAFRRFCEHINEFEEIAREHTAMVVLSGDLLEADDLIAGVVQQYHHTHDITIISADKDLLQLLRHDSVALIDPATGNARSLSDYNMDADYFLFQKCLRGDMGDNVKAAFPRVRKTRIQQAYTDPFEYDKLMKEEWTTPDGKKMVVGDLFKENKLLMDLSAQPQEIIDSMYDIIEEGITNPGKFNHFKFLRFCGKFGLRKVVDSLHIYQRMLV